MLRHIINTLLIILTVIAWIGMVGSIATNQHIYGLIGVIACFLGLGLLYYKDWRHWDQEDDDE
ncbi:hypothetical protein Barba22A_gp029 [Rheinheimera phage vB_RspM_Barba22A]|jgi:cadmium resistance protein CadD (predicted permease)|uniref:Uncharacterized protein n=82 Tax=Barbavirus TaxID=2733095 RepID=A0A7G9VS56_9CAUD|nr:hypothetical protein HOV44_gp031 [Rheinheimera phage Barba5S]YP_009822767.1 hypothetical protein HOV45_gp031 [Rheinheimera phage Barba8S]YP_009822906.1 hypothetical protein HOV46_gp029 [Rheinheimera phage vB_RspM_Barba18A]YP_009823185.1 hypothetical protein HOV48_gp029 [Rheinheimera phage Barba21A]QCQ57880.1 hypothetical protein Barba1A_gp029 [Rheinheimera phage vB_RspM_Barba1A]QCQ58016.1 hypothetical protein Barba1S_gp029 [Rheinheimera phage vB_RspM_Barba1S]QCQ58152.1 hypothetical protein